MDNSPLCKGPPSACEVSGGFLEEGRTLELPVMSYLQREGKSLSPFHLPDHFLLLLRAPPLEGLS